MKIAAIILIGLGALWIGQGLGYVGGSFMTDQRIWAWIGAATMIAGVALGIAARRR